MLEIAIPAGRPGVFRVDVKVGVENPWGGLQVAEFSADRKTTTLEAEKSRFKRDSVGLAGYPL